MALRALAVQAWEESSQAALIQSARQAVVSTLGSDAADVLAFDAVSQLDGATLVVFRFADDDVRVGVHRVGSEDWRVVTVVDDDGWVLAGGPFGSLVELGEWFAANPPPGSDVEPWVAGEAVSVGDLRSYDGIVYRCIQSHTTQEDWTPPATPSLWEVA